MRSELLGYIYDRNLHQKKKITKFLENESVSRDLDTFLNEYSGFMKSNDITVQELAGSYLQMVNDMIEARIEFTRTGEYPRGDQDSAIQEVYSNPKVMTKYMLGLALSQFLWKQHYLLLKFYKENLGYTKNNGKYLEVGSGHGLFLKELLSKVGTNFQMDVVDISSTSIEISKKITKTLLSDSYSNINFIHSDILKYQSDATYDFITIGEVLEHVSNPDEILKSLNRLLSPSGYMYVSTCANSPALDHIYHYHNVEEIKEMIVSTGFEIIEEIIIPVEDYPIEKIIKYKIDVMYAAIVKRK